MGQNNCEDVAGKEIKKRNSFSDNIITVVLFIIIIHPEEEDEEFRLCSIQLALRIIHSVDVPEEEDDEEKEEEDDGFKSCIFLFL